MSEGCFLWSQKKGDSVELYCEVGGSVALGQSPGCIILLFPLLPVWEKAQEWVPPVNSVSPSSVLETLVVFSSPFWLQQRCGREINWPPVLTSCKVEGWAWVFQNERYKNSSQTTTDLKIKSFLCCSPALKVKWWPGFLWGSVCGRNINGHRVGFVVLESLKLCSKQITTWSLIVETFLEGGV